MELSLLKVGKILDNNQIAETFKCSTQGGMRRSHATTHHIDWLSRGGEDSIENTAALCPNCHDKMHIVDSSHDVNYLKEKVQRHFNRVNLVNLP
jgi:5-methylcytosine-specific restriction endonuclease McrA